MVKPAGKLLGVVLCGGKSSRMGTDKGLIRRNGVPWAALAAAKLGQLGLPVVISLNPVQASAYLRYFEDRVLVFDREDHAGPLAGIGSVHARFPSKDILALSCDMPGLEIAFLERLLTLYRDKPRYEFFAPRTADSWEPLCAIYSSRGLMRQDLLIPARSPRSARALLENGRTLAIEIGSPAPFANLNTRQELGRCDRANNRANSSLC